jgi:hypothetical protein
MRRAIQSLLLSTVIVVMCAPAQVRADGFISPWTGANVGHSPSSGRASVGVSAGYMGAGTIGGEFDFGYSPNFFGQSSVIGRNSVLSTMGNLIVGIPIGGMHGPGFRPFVATGFGLIRTDIDGRLGAGAVRNNDLGFNVGGGVMGYFNDHFGLRGDVRYFRNIRDNSTANNLNLNLGEFSYWRAAMGIVLR